MTYHILNLGTGGQDADIFETMRKSKTKKLNEIIPLKKLDVIVEYKKGKIHS